MSRAGEKGERVMTHARSRHGKGEKGLAIAMTTLVLIPLMIFAALGVDLASFYSRISALQRAADAAALAGAVYMPNLSKATTEANASLASNGFVNGSNGIVITIAQGSKTTALRVTVTDTNVKRWFSQVFVAGNESLSRSAEAEYNLPLPLGSPLNYFGGDATRTQPATVTDYNLTWPPNYSTWQPANPSCNVGTSSDQGFGRWSGSGPSYSSTGFSSSNPQCQFPTQNPTNAPCNEANSVGGSWNTSNPVFRPTTRFTSGTGNRLCTYNTNTAGTVPAGAIGSATPSVQPVSRPCNTGSSSGFTGSGSNTWSATGYNANNPQCRWIAQITTTSTTPPNPIDSSRSPGFWAAIEGPKTQAFQGDAYNTQCWATTNCTSVQNNMFLPTTDPNRGFWYAIKIPAGLTGSVAINVYDGAYNPSGSANAQAGDRALGDATAFPTQFQVYRQTNPLDFTARTALFSGSPGTTPGTCNISVTNTAAWTNAWQNICTLSSVQPNEIYLLNVQTTGNAGDGVNGYSLEAVANGSYSGTQPALFALSNMGMQNNNSCSPTPCTPPPATFYLAEVGPQYAGRVLVMELWDAGDVSSGTTARMRPMRPSPTVPKPVVNVPAADCTYSSDTSPNPFISNGSVSSSIASRGSDNGTVCEIQSSVSGTQRTGGNWLRIRIQVPANYTCVAGVNPETTANSCWWGIQYLFSGSANDVTTWQARIEGNPLQLTL
jgi:Flp pilus assembly protein TadG